MHPKKRIATAKTLKKEKLPSLVSPTEEPLQAWYMDEATNRYLLTDPSSFIIFGKPGLNSVDLASAIAKSWNCILISPLSLIQDEINIGSEEGQRMKETLANDKRIAPDIVMNLIRRRINMSDIRHRGYVVEGLPLIPHETSLDRRRPKVHGDQICDRTESCSHSPDQLPDDSICQTFLDHEREIPRQVDEIFTEWPIKPSIIIYMMCPKQDVSLIIQRSQRAETATADAVVEDIPEDGSNSPLDLHQDTEEPPIVNDDRRNHSERFSDMEQKVELQCDLYMRLALPVIDKWVLEYDPQRVIRVDGRGSTQRMLQTVNARLRMLPLQPSILPQQMTVEEDDSNLEEDVKVRKEIKKLEMVEILQHKEIVSAEYPWRLHACEFCPVALTLGRKKKGYIEYAVRFLRNIFFLSSQEAVDMFVENPRTFLSPPNPQEICKIAVCGSLSSGKSKLSQQLAEVFDGTVIDMKKILPKTDTRYNRFNYYTNEEVLKSLYFIEERWEETFKNKLYRDGRYVVDGIPIENLTAVIKQIRFEDIVILWNRYLFNYKNDRYFQDQFANFKYEIEQIRRTHKFNVIMCELSKFEDVSKMITYVVDCLKLPSKTPTSATNAVKLGTTEETTLTGDNTSDEERPPHVIDLETAERLLDCGYYFLSSFGRWCPVQAYANESIPAVHSLIIPVIHQDYIYFLAGEDALSAFLKEPSKYLNRDFRPSALPLRIAVIGPPKCGKTTLADRFAKTYGLKRITRDVALRHMSKHYGWSKSAQMAEDQLRAGQPASIDSVTRAIEILSLGPRAISHGYILDDYPSTREETEQLILSGVQPMIVLDMKADLLFCLECQSANDGDTNASSTSFSFGMLRYENWQVHQASFRDWLKKFARNVVELDAMKSKWNVWTLADRAVRSRFSEITLYQRDADLDKIHSLRHMCVSPFEFQERQSQYKSYCPVCLFRENVLQQASRQRMDNQGMVQFEEHFYWICPRHMAVFTADPRQYLPPINTASLPDEVPQIFEQVVDVKHVCLERRLRLDGWCPVTYVDGPEKGKLTRGRTDLAVLFGQGLYLLCSEECRDKFLARHHDYCNVEIASVGEVDPRYLPDRGFLEHTVAKQVVEAVKRVAARRPKMIGLSAAASAAIYIGVHLKTHNADVDEVLAYEVTDERMAERDKIVKIVTDTVKTRPNPHAF
ncbi:Uncharacterized protein C6orf224 [Harpegnathos saltator]|uniref:Uncharacterized protein C6orf224 n=3 Tax=Harpegnathos saltator TaxID=610380 RepID=E2C134_HARSA|nr:Uncharacterized protein C6orf224 [Harpegnathos saltator]